MDVYDIDHRRHHRLRLHHHIRGRGTPDPGMQEKEESNPNGASIRERILERRRRQHGIRDG